MTSRHHLVTLGFCPPENTKYVCHLWRYQAMQIVLGLFVQVVSLNCLPQHNGSEGDVVVGFFLWWSHHWTFSSFFIQQQKQYPDLAFHQRNSKLLTDLWIIQRNKDTNCRKQMLIFVGHHTLNSLSLHCVEVEANSLWFWMNWPFKTLKRWLQHY